PSQSKISALGMASHSYSCLADAAKDLHEALGHWYQFFAYADHQLQRIVLCGLGIQILAIGVAIVDLQHSRDVDLGAALRDQPFENIVGETCAPVQYERGRMCGHD